MSNNSGCFWFFAIVIGLVIIGFAASQKDGDSSADDELYFSDSVKTYGSDETISTDTLSLPVPNPKIQSYPPCPLLADTPEGAYDDGYEDGYEQGEKDGERGILEIGYDDTNDYDGELAEQYEMGYEDGYYDGYREEHD